MIFALADRLGKLPDEIRELSVEDFIAFGAYFEIRKDHDAP